MSLSPDIKTFNEWSNAGYKIKKGSKAVGKTSAGFLFSRSQVSYSPRPSRWNSNPDGDWDNQDFADGGDSYGFDISQYGDR